MRRVLERGKAVHLQHVSGHNVQLERERAEIERQSATIAHAQQKVQRDRTLEAEIDEWFRQETEHVERERALVAALAHGEGAAALPGGGPQHAADNRGGASTPPGPKVFPIWKTSPRFGGVGQPHQGEKLGTGTFEPLRGHSAALGSPEQQRWHGTTNEAGVTAANADRPDERSRLR